MRPGENANTVAAEQIRSWGRQAALTAAPALSFDAGYDPVPLRLAMADEPLCLVVRLRAGRGCSADPTAQPKTGRPRRHGAKFLCAAPTTWPEPTAQWMIATRAASSSRPGAAGIPSRRCTPGAAPAVLGRGGAARSSAWRWPTGPAPPPQPLWFWGWGPTPPDLAEVWQAYIARFAIAHTCRFFKQALKWTTPKRRAPSAADRWTWLLIRAFVH